MLNFFNRRRKELQRSQQDIADLTGYTSATVSRWELGMNLPSLSKAAIIAAAYEVPLDDYLRQITAIASQSRSNRGRPRRQPLAPLSMPLAVA